MGFKFNPFTGTLDVTGGQSSGSNDNFSYETIASGVTIIIPQYQQMIVYQTIEVIDTLDLIGDLILID